MTAPNARALAKRHLALLRADSSMALAINDDLTEKHPAGFVFFYNTQEYWRTRDPLTSLAGNGPILVKRDGTVIVLPTDRPIEESLRNA